MSMIAPKALLLLPHITIPHVFKYYVAIDDRTHFKKIKQTSSIVFFRRLQNQPNWPSNSPPPHIRKDRIILSSEIL